MNDVEKKIYEVFLENGVNIVSDDPDDEILLDSIEFVSIIISLEDVFNIEVPDEYLLIEKLNTFEQFCDLVNTLIGSELK